MVEVKMEFGVDVSPNATAALRSKRFWARNKTLLDLCIKSILKNPEFFLGRLENPLQNLPNSIVQKFFMVMAQRFDKGPSSVELFKPTDMPLLFLLLNSNAEEFSLLNLLQAAHVYLPEAQPDNCVLDHALNNCPNFRAIFISLLPFNGALPEELITRMSTNWQKLKSLTVEGGNVLSDSTIDLVAKYLPELQRLALFEKNCTEELDILPRFTMESVDNLSHMKKLQFLNLNLGDNKVYYDDCIWAHVAGMMPALKKLSLQRCFLNFEIEKNSLFIKHYEKLYPGKELVLGCVKILCAEFDGKWPPNVTCEELSLQGPLQSLEDLTAIPKGAKFLRLRLMYPHQVHAILEIFGASVIKLEVNDLLKQHGDLLNINKMLLMCPQVESFDVYQFSGHFVIRQFDSVLPKCFKHLKNFSVTRSGVYGLEKINPMLKQILLAPGNVHWSPHLDVFETMCTHLEVLRETQNLCSYYTNLNSFMLRSYEVHPLLQNDFFELAYRLMSTSPLLQWFQVLIVVTEEADEAFRIDLIEKCKRLKEVSQILEVKCKVVLSFPHHQLDDVVVSDFKDF